MAGRILKEEKLPNQIVICLVIQFMIMKKQGTQNANVFDEQPSVRGVYPHSIPVVYARCVDYLEIDGTVTLEGTYQNCSLQEIEGCKEVQICLKKQ